MRRPARGRETGLTVMEVFVAAIVLATLASAAIVVGAAELRFLMHSFRETVALRVATSHVERLRAGTVSLEPGTRAAPVDPSAREALRDATAEESITPAGEHLAAVAVTVRWTEAGGGTAEVRVDALVARESVR